MAKIKCPDCKKRTGEYDACEHCGCPLTETALNDLAEGLASVVEEIEGEERLAQFPYEWRGEEV